MLQNQRPILSTCMRCSTVMLAGLNMNRSTAEPFTANRSTALRAPPTIHAVLARLDYVYVLQTIYILIWHRQFGGTRQSTYPRPCRTP